MKRSFFASALLGLALLAGLVFTVQSWSTTTRTDAQAMAAANQLVKAGHNAEAAQMYEQLARQNPWDATVLYNLGNAYFLQGDAGRALAAYEQAAALAPRDADIRANLALAQQALGLAPSPAAGPLAVVAGVGNRWLTGDELALLALGAWFAFGLLVFAWRAAQPGRRPAVLRLGMVAALVIVLATSGVWVSRTVLPQPSAQVGIGQQAALPGFLADPS
jgi:tetratricopeptide (TPR) repeat protein